MTGINKRSNKPRAGQKKDFMRPSGYSNEWVEAMNKFDQERRKYDNLSPVEKRAKRMREQLSNRKRTRKK